MKREFGNVSKCAKCEKKATRYFYKRGFFIEQLVFYCEEHYIEKLKHEGIIQW